MKIICGMFARYKGELVCVDRIIDDEMAIVTSTKIRSWHKKVPLNMLTEA